MNYAKLKLLAQMGGKLFLSLQVRKVANYSAYRILIPVIRKWGPDKLVFSPPNVVIFVTSRCDKQCDFCYFRGELNGADADQFELTYEKFLKIITHPLVKNSLRIAFTGGEPLLNKDVFKMIREAKRRHHIVSVVTNGKLLRKCAPEILDAPPDLLTISYYPEDHNELSGTLPLFANNFTMKFNFVMSVSRMKHLDNAIQLAVENNVRIIDLENVYFSTNFESGEVPIEFGDDEYLKLKKKMSLKYGRKILISWGPLFNKYKKNISTKCCVFWHSIHVDAQGRISPCCQYPLKTYRENIFQNRDSWNSEVMTTLRRWMRKNKIPDACKDCGLIYEDYLGI